MKDLRDDNHKHYMSAPCVLAYYFGKSLKTVLPIGCHIELSKLLLTCRASHVYSGGYVSLMCSTTFNGEVVDKFAEVFIDEEFSY